MLDRRDGAALAVADNGAELGGGDGQMAGVDQPVEAAGKPGSKENDAMIASAG